MIIETRAKSASEVRTCAMRMTPELATGETISGTPTITSSPSGLTFGSIAATGSQMRIDGVLTPTGQGVTFTVSGGTSGQTYTITVSCSTSASQTVEGVGYLEIE